jgi:hypothetical protein
MVLMASRQCMKNNIKASPCPLSLASTSLHSPAAPTISVTPIRVNKTGLENSNEEMVVAYDMKKDEEHFVCYIDPLALLQNKI